MKFVRVGAAVGAVAIIVTACSSTPSGSGAAAGGTPIKVGIELPMTGGEAPNGVPTANGVQLALEQNKVDGYNITINQQDDAVNGKHNADQGAKNMTTLANDTAVQFVVGPYNSSVAQAEIPVSNAAGLMQCSPANTAVDLTKGDAGRRPSAPRTPTRSRTSASRPPTTTRAPAPPTSPTTRIGAKTAYVLDDTQTYGKGLAKGFTDAFTTFGGQIVGTRRRPGHHHRLHQLRDQGEGPQPRRHHVRRRHDLGPRPVPQADGAAGPRHPARRRRRHQRRLGRHGQLVPQHRRRRRRRTRYSTVAAIHDIPDPAKFAADYKAKFNADPGSYSAPGYACTQIFLAALKAVGASAGGDMAKLREAVRAYIADPSHTYDTVLGKFGFDANGDTTQHTISYYQYDPTAKDWKFLKQRDFTADPVK